MPDLALELLRIAGKRIDGATAVLEPVLTIVVRQAACNGGRFGCSGFAPIVLRLQPGSGDQESQSQDQCLVHVCESNNRFPGEDHQEGGRYLQKLLTLPARCEA